MKPGDYIDMKGPVAGFDWSVTSGEVAKIGMIAGGVGVSPMVQIMREVLYAGVPIQMKLLWAAEREDELMYKEKMSFVQGAHRNLETIYSLAHPSAGWTGEVGIITKSMIHRHMFPPASDTKIVICGPYKMCQAMKQALRELGYTDDMFYSYM
jgi:cytochrome-b5 reductase